MKKHYLQAPNSAHHPHWRMVVVAVFVATSVDVATGQSTLRVVSTNDSSASSATPGPVSGGPPRQTNHSEQRVAERSAGDSKSGKQDVELSQAAPLHSVLLPTKQAPLNLAATPANGNRTGASELRVITPPGKGAAVVPPVVAEQLRIASSESVPAGDESGRPRATKESSVASHALAADHGRVESWGSTASNSPLAPARREASELRVVTPPGKITPALPQIAATNSVPLLKLPSGRAAVEQNLSSGTTEPGVAKQSPAVAMGGAEPTRIALPMPPLAPESRAPSAPQVISPPGKVVAAGPPIVVEPVPLAGSPSTPTAISARPPVASQAPSGAQVPAAADTIRAESPRVALLPPALAPVVHEPATPVNVDRSASPELSAVVTPGKIPPAAPPVVADRVRVLPSTPIPATADAHPSVAVKAPSITTIPLAADEIHAELTRAAGSSPTLTPPKRESSRTANVDRSATPELQSVAIPNQVIAAAPPVVVDPVRVTPATPTPAAVESHPPVATHELSVTKNSPVADPGHAEPTRVALLPPTLTPPKREEFTAANGDRSAAPGLRSVVTPSQVATASPVVLDPVPVAAPQSARMAPERQLPVATHEPPLPVIKSDEVVVHSRQSPASGMAPGTQATTTIAPNRNQVSVATDPADPNVFQFQFAAAGDELYAPPVIPGGSPPAESLGGAQVPPLPGRGPLPFGGGVPFGQWGCPYGAGQSGERALCGVDCGRNGAPCNATWSDRQCIPWSLFGPGEYVGPARTADVATYFLRVNDFITLTFIESRHKSAQQYHIGVGDRLQVEWLQGAANMEARLNRDLLVQPDGTVTLPLIGDVAAAGKTVNEFREELVSLFSKYQRDPQITVTPLQVNVAIQDLLKAVTSKSSSSGQIQDLKVTPEGTIQAAGIGSVYVQGLTLDELRYELEARYAAVYGPGLSVSPALTQRATSYVFVGGEVKEPGRFTLEGPTTVMQAIALAHGWNNGGNVRQVVIFRRDENWCLKATKIDIRAPLYGKSPCPANDVWLRDNDLVIVPKSKILVATDVIELYFTRGVYAVFPINYVYDFSKNSGVITPIP